mgnify:CR=1 FL=1
MNISKRTYFEKEICSYKFEGKNNLWVGICILEILRIRPKRTTKLKIRLSSEGPIPSWWRKSLVQSKVYNANLGIKCWLLGVTE